MIIGGQVGVFMCRRRANEEGEEEVDEKEDGEGEGLIGLLLPLAEG